MDLGRLHGAGIVAGSAVGLFLTIGEFDAPSTRLRRACGAAGVADVGAVRRVTTRTTPSTRTRARGRSGSSDPSWSQSPILVMAGGVGSRTITPVPEAQDTPNHRQGRPKEMMNWMQYLQARLETSERGAAAVEYGLLVALIAAVIVGIVLILGGQIQDAFETVSNSL
jgi:pilus assembly protein Flp/PilA